MGSRRPGSWGCRTGCAAPVGRGKGMGSGRKQRQTRRERYAGAGAGMEHTCGRCLLGVGHEAAGLDHGWTTADCADASWGTVLRCGDLGMGERYTTCRKRLWHMGRCAGVGQGAAVRGAQRPTVLACAGDEPLGDADFASCKMVGLRCAGYMGSMHVFVEAKVRSAGSRAALCCACWAVLVCNIAHRSAE